MPGGGVRSIRAAEARSSHQLKAAPSPDSDPTGGFRLKCDFADLSGS